MPKRGNGEGYVYRAKNGSWIAKLQIGYLDNGYPKIKSFSARTRADALRRMNEYKKKLATFDKSGTGEGLLYDSMMKWLTEVKRIELKTSSYQRLEVTIDSNIRPYIGDLVVDEITASTIQTELINALFEKGLSYSTIKKVYNALNAFFKYMMIKGTISKDPMLGVVLPAMNNFAKSKRDIKYLTPDEIERFTHRAAAKSMNGSYVYRYGFIYVFMLYTGLRCGEMLGLQWKHIDIEAKVVHIRQTLLTVKNDSSEGAKYVTMLQDTAKTASGIRDVFLCQKAVDAISAYKELFYSGDEDAFVVTTKEGNPLRTRHFERSVNYIFKSAGIDASGVHILRHTFASMLFARKVDIKYISRLLGHSDVSTTYNIYIHLTEKGITDAVSTLDL